MKRSRDFLKENWLVICIFLILILATILRFYNYNNRWGLAYDQAHDALVARYALESHKVPLVGPFSSAGPFQTGGEWYWLIMIGTAINSSQVITPWIVMTLLYIGFVIVSYFVGKDMLNKYFGLLLALLSSVSTAQVVQSTHLNNQSSLAIISLLAIWSMVKYTRTKKIKYLFFLGFFSTLGPLIHMQGALLVVLPILTLLFTGIPAVRSFIALVMGAIIPVIPIFIFDTQNNFVNIRNLMYYFIIDQYNISLDVLDRRWLTFAGVYWPRAWSYVIGGSYFISFLIFISLFFFTLHNFFRKKISKEILIINVFLVISVVFLRYSRVPLFDSYIVFLHPFILISTSWMIFNLIKWRWAAGVILLITVLLLNLINDFREIMASSNQSQVLANQEVKAIKSKFPEDKFSVYSYHYKWSDKNAILSLFLSADGIINDQGKPISIVISTRSGEFEYPVLHESEGGYQVLDLSSSSSAELTRSRWVLMNPSAIYKATEEWRNP